MKQIILLLAIGFCSDSIASEGLMDRQGLINVVGNSFDAMLCDKTNNTCMGVTQTACFAEAKKILREKCSSDIPGEIENTNELIDYTVSVYTCVVREYNKIHNDAIVKNKNIADCQKFVLKK